MILNILTKIFGSKNDRELKSMRPLVESINALEPKIASLNDLELKNQTVILKNRLQNGETVDDILPSAFAVMREASIRVLEMRHYDVQLIGGIVLHQGKISEMKTGEGKTLVATLPAYLNALEGKGVHIITVNDYLATRDAQWMGGVFKFLGLTVATIVHGLDDIKRKEAYDADITYGTNNEFGFDYLRDNMKFESDELVQRELNYAIVDEVDSILIDESRTPLIISGPAEKSTSMYFTADNIVPKLKENDDYIIDEKAKNATLTESGIAKAESALSIENLYDPKNIEILHHVNQALKAHTLFKKDVDYIVKDGEVVIVDEFTGRLMAGRRYSDGLHQALEAKENVKIENENQTLATITFQNYFRMYDKLSGMTGTAETEAAEMNKTYNLDVIVIPTHMPMVRKDYPDVIYKTKKDKYEAVIEEIIHLHEKGQPVLVGTISINVSEDLSKTLKKRKVKHNVLNAKHHGAEAEIISNAGQMGAVTIATNMAGRGTDIVLGDGVIDVGGLHILGTERHESRRIDNQLRGRSGRQGDPGSSRFYISLEDDLMRIFGGERITSIMEKFGMEDGEPIEHNLLSKALENAQRKVEGHNYDIRKQLLEYDDVMNQQRDVIYRQRRQALSGDDLRPFVLDMITDQACDIALSFATSKESISQDDFNALNKALIHQFNFALSSETNLEEITPEELVETISLQAEKLYCEREQFIGEREFRRFERFIILQTVDTLWKDHLLNMDHLKEGIGLRGYAQQNPLVIYKKEGFEMFQDMIEKVKKDTLNILFRFQLEKSETIESVTQTKEQNLQFSHGDQESAKKPIRRSERKVGRNEPCPCGSGKKYKKCCA